MHDKHLSMLVGVLWFIGLLPVGVAIDWLVCTRLAAYRTGFEYRYRPGKVRYALLTPAVAVFAYTLNPSYDPSQASMLLLLIVGIAWLGWSIVAWRDVTRELIPADAAEDDY